MITPLTSTDFVSHVLFGVWIALATLFAAGTGLCVFFPRLLSEQGLARLVRAFSFATVGLSLAFLVLPKDVEWTPLLWFHVEHGHVALSWLFPWQSVVFGVLASLLFAVVMRFSVPYLHREPGFHRFFYLSAMLYLGVLAICFGGNFDLLFLGWELVGVASVSLIAFFDDSPRSFHNSRWALAAYRICDVAFLIVIFMLHEWVGSSQLREVARLLNTDITWQVLFSILLLIASLGKSAQMPFTGWITRAMEGPTPSSAIFYGALSIHLGPFLLMRTDFLWAALPFLQFRVWLVVLGGLSAAFATWMGKVRADSKTALALASTAQVGLIFVELGLGWETLAFWHLVAHALLRTWQFLTAPSWIGWFADDPELRRYESYRVPNKFYYYLMVECGLPDLWRAVTRGLQRAVDAALKAESMALRWALLPGGAKFAEARIFAGAGAGSSILSRVRRACFVLGTLGVMFCHSTWGDLLSLLVLFLPLAHASVSAWRHSARGRSFIFVGGFAGAWLLAAFGALMGPRFGPLVDKLLFAPLALGLAGLFPLHLWRREIRHVLRGVEFAVFLSFPYVLFLDHAATLFNHNVVIVAWALGTGLYQVMIALYDTELSRPMEKWVHSQLLIVIAAYCLGGKGHSAAYALGLSWLVCGFLCLRSFGWLRAHHTLHPGERLLGLGRVALYRGRIFTVAGWLASGVPFGIAYWGEDFLFHSLADERPRFLLAALLVSALGGLAFYRMKGRLFSGRMDPEVEAVALREEFSWKVAVEYLVLLAVLAIGVFPEPLFEWIERLP
jgi:NADH-quinone oxidoreductase subunit L